MHNNTKGNISQQYKTWRHKGTRAYHEIAIFENNRPTIGEQYNAIQNFYNQLLTDYCHTHEDTTA